MYAGTLSYFAQLQAQYELSALSSKAKTGLLAGKGIFGYEPKVDYFFGLPRTISSGGIHLDIETTRVVRALDNDQQKTIDFAIQTGPIGSALEHQVPEQMFNTDPANPTQAISTVKALQLANAQGQQIYKIDQTNIDTVLQKLNLSDTIKQDIQSSVNAGKYVITHTDNVSVPGWSGAGYAIIDPLTGSDAYMISGGENGGQYKPDAYMDRVLNFLSLYLIQLDYREGGLLLVFGSIPKQWIGVNPFLLGSKNQLTSVLRGVLKSPIGRWIFMRTVLVPLVTYIAVGIGSYNFGILVQAFIYAI